MSGRPDPFELLTAARPVIVDPDAAAPGRDPAADRLLASIVTTGHRRRRRHLWAAGVVVAVAGAGSVAAAVWSRQPADLSSIACYRTSDVGASDVAQVPATDDPAAACAKFWGTHTGDASGTPTAVCVNDAGVTAVVPDDGTGCAGHGWAAAEPPTGDGHRSVDLAATLAVTLGEGCLDETATRHVIGDAIAAADAGAWTVALREPFDTVRACGAVTVQPSDRTITITPRPAGPTPPPSSTTFQEP